MKLLALLPLAAVAVAATHVADPQWLRSILPEERDIGISEFKAGHEYEYLYEAQLATGIPGSSEQHTANRLQAGVRLTFETQHKCILSIIDARWARLNERLPTPRRIVPFEAFEHLPVPEDIKRTLLLPVLFKYNKGIVSEIVFDGEETPWSANIKRGVLNAIQVNVHKVNRVDRAELSDSELGHDSDAFTVIEATLEGECETDYTVVSRPSAYVDGKWAVNVTKSINFERCNERPQRKYNYRFADICPTCDKRYTDQERVLKSSTVFDTKMLCSEEKRGCIIDQCRVESQYNFVPFGYEANMISTYVNTLLRLVKSSRASGNVRKPSNPIASDSDMLATMDWEVQREQFAMTGEYEQSPFLRPFIDSFEGGSVLRQFGGILKKFVHYMRDSVDEEAPRHFAKLVKWLQYLKWDHLQLVHTAFYANAPEEFTREEHAIIKSVLPEAVALCGTHDCVKHLSKQMINDAANSGKANALIRKLVDIKVVSEPIIEHIWKVAESTDKPDLKHSVYLTVGSLLNALCMPNEDKLAMESKVEPNTFCPRSLKQKWTEKLIGKFERAESNMDKIVCLKALANAGLDTSVLQLEKIIRNTEKEYQIPIRTEAILALRQLKEVMPHKIVRTLMPLVLNKREPTPVRITAFYQLMECLPNKPILDQLAIMLGKETNKQVASFVYTTMQNMANSTVPCELRMAKDLQQSLRLAKYLPVRSWLGYSKFMRSQWYSEENNIGTVINAMVLKASDSMLPKALGIRFDKLFGGEWKKHLLSFGINQHNVDAPLRRYMRTYTHSIPSTLADILSGKSVSAESNYRGEMKSLFESMKLSERDNEMSDNERVPFGYMYMRYFDQDYAVLPLLPLFESTVAQSLPEPIRLALLHGRSGALSDMVKNARKYLVDMSLPINMNSATLLQQSERRIATSMGPMLRLSIKTPAVFKAHGLLNVDFDQTNPMHKLKVQLNNFKPSMVITNVMKIEVWTPLASQALKVLSQAKVYMPFSGQLAVDGLKPQPQVQFVWNADKELSGPIDIVRVQTRPVLVAADFTKYAPDEGISRYWLGSTNKEEITVHSDDWDRVNTFDKELGIGRWLGIAFSARGHWHRTPAAPSAVVGTPVCPFTGPNKMVVTMRPAYEMPKEVRLTASGKLFEVVEGTLRPEAFSTFYTSAEKSGGSAEGEGQSRSRSRSASSESTESMSASASRSNQFLRESSEEAAEFAFPTQMSTSPHRRHSVRLSVETRGSSIKRHAELSAHCQCAQQMQTCMCQLAAQRTPIANEEQTDWKLEGKLNTIYPNVPLSMEQLRTMDKQPFHCTIKTKWGPRTDMKSYMEIKMVADRSEMQKRRIERSIYGRLSQLHADTHRSLFSPVAQYKHMLKYAAFDEYKLKVDYEMNGYLRNVTNLMYRIIKSHPYVLPQSEVNQINAKNSRNELKIKFNVDPINGRYLNATVKSPIETLKVIDIALPTRMPVLNMRRRSTHSTSMSDMFSNMFTGGQSAQCQVRSDRVTNVRGAEFNVPITTCYSLLAKDCSAPSRSQFAVMIRKKSSGGEHKIIKIVTPGTKLIVRPTADNSGIECELNGDVNECSRVQPVTQMHGHTVLKVTVSRAENSANTPPYVHIDLPEAGIQIHFDTYAADINVSPLYADVMCGLCASGTENAESADTQIMYNTPEDVREHFKRYLIRDDEQCDVEEDIVDNVQSYERRPLSWTRPLADSILRQFGVLDEQRPCELYESCPRPFDYSNDYDEPDVCDRYPVLCERELSQLSIHSPMRPHKREHTVAPLQSTKVLERGHDVCFSTEPVRRCPPGTVTKAYEPQRAKVAFSCMRRTSPQHYTLLREYERIAARGGVVTEAGALKPSFAHELTVPSTCIYL